MAKRYLLVLRGMPGGGKSYHANRVIQKYHGLIKGLSSVVHSADKYFLRPDGIYSFDPKLLPNAHKWCFGEVEKDMGELTDDLSHGDIDLIILDNTNTQKWEYKNYIELAKQYGYIVKEKIVGSQDPKDADLYAKRNKHGVPKETILKMMARFEK